MENTPWIPSIKKGRTPKIPPFLSRLFFCWTVPKLLLGRRGGLKQDDVDYLPAEDEATDITYKLNQNWSKELKQKRPSLRRALLATFGWKLYTTVLMVLFDQCFLRVCTPVLIGYLIFQAEGVPTFLPGIAPSILFIVSIFLSTLIQHFAWFRLGHLGMKVRVGVTALVYQKVLTLSQDSVGNTGIGQLTNIISNDVNRFDQMQDIPYVVAVPLQVVAAAAILCQYIQFEALFGIGILLILLPLQACLGRGIGSWRAAVATKTDRRIRLLSEVIEGITLVKISTWESIFSSLVKEARTNELKCIDRKNWLMGINYSVFNVAAKLCLLCTFLGLELTDYNISAATIFVTLSMYNLVTPSASIFLPQGMGGLTEILVSISRIQEVLLLEDREPSSEVRREEQVPVSVHVEHLSAKWGTAGPLVLEDVSFHVEDKQFVGIVGSVGSGKTSLLEGILGELKREGGHVKVVGKIAYATQDACIFEGTIRENILFGMPYNEIWYTQVVEAVALDKDFQGFPLEDLSLIGDGGTSLSGGQKARISLARAVYSKADVYLLDDPLSAVDLKVGRHLMDHCIRSLLKSKCVLLVTHQTRHLKEADFIISMKHGRIERQGKYSDIFQSEVQEAETELGMLTIDELTEQEVEDSITLTLPSREKGDYQTFEKAQFARTEMQKSEGAEWDTFWKYIRSGNSWLNLQFIFVVIVLTQVCTSGSDYWLKGWADTFDTEYPSRKHKDLQILTVYGCAVAAILLLSFVKTFKIFRAGMSSAATLHDRLVSSLLRAQMRFFELNPKGRILNRCSNDIGDMDEILPERLYIVIATAAMIFGSLVIIILTQPVQLLPAILLVVFFVFLLQIYTGASFEIKRFQSIARSPIFSKLSSTLSKLSVVRAFGIQSEFMRQFHSFQNDHSTKFFLYLSSFRWLQLTAELGADLFMALLIMYFYQFGSRGSSVGISIASALGLTVLVCPLMRQVSEIMNLMVTVERVIEYGNLPEEAPAITNFRPRLSWPESGEIQFQNLCLSYEKGVNILSDITLQIAAGEKIGIVGRTGAGKSTLISALLRLAEPNFGHIAIDQLNISQIGLRDLRRKISVIPQSPILFEGTFRKNLDPFEQHPDEDLWRVLQSVELKELMGSHGLEFKVVEGGTNFSQGERQLICLARAMLQGNKIIVLDEATANVDRKTDSIIQNALRDEFRSCTVLTIAHRLETVLDVDRILVLDKGQILEYDEPWKLLERKDSFLSQLVDNAGTTQAIRLRQLATQARMDKNNVEKVSTHP